MLTLYDSERLLATSEIVEDSSGRIAFKPLWPGRRMSPPPSRAGMADLSGSSRTPILDSLLNQESSITSSGLIRPQWVDVCPTPSPFNPPRPSSITRLRTASSSVDVRMHDPRALESAGQLGGPYRRSPSAQGSDRNGLSTPVQLALSRFEVGLLMKTDDDHHLLSEQQAQMLSEADQSARAQGSIEQLPKMRSSSSLPALKK